MVERMSNIEHYFENMLFYGEDTTGNPNKNALTKEEQNAVEECASYVLYTLFCGRADFVDFVRGNIYGQKDGEKNG
jgi:hypothetical protein